MIKIRQLTLQRSRQIASFNSHVKLTEMPSVSPSAIFLWFWFLQWLEVLVICAIVSIGDFESIDSNYDWLKYTQRRQKIVW